MLLYSFLNLFNEKKIMKSTLSLNHLFLISIIAGLDVKHTQVRNHFSLTSILYGDFSSFRVGAQIRGIPNNLTSFLNMRHSRATILSTNTPPHLHSLEIV